MYDRYSILARRSEESRFHGLYYVASNYPVTLGKVRHINYEHYIMYISLPNVCKSVRKRYLEVCM